QPFGVVSRSTGAVADAVYLRSQALQLDVLIHDAALAWRNALRRPAFTLLVVLTLALGIGVNSAVFALLDGILLRPLPYRDPSPLRFRVAHVDISEHCRGRSDGVGLRRLAFASRVLVDGARVRRRGHDWRRQRTAR